MTRRQNRMRGEPSRGRTAKLIVVSFLILGAGVLFISLPSWATDAYLWLASAEGAATLRAINRVVVIALGIWILLALATWSILVLLQRPPRYRIAAEQLEPRLRRHKRWADLADGMFRPFTAVWRWVVLRRARSGLAVRREVN